MLHENGMTFLSPKFIHEVSENDHVHYEVLI